jgi:hypothetical protein
MGYKPTFHVCTDLSNKRNNGGTKLSNIPTIELVQNDTGPELLLVLRNTISGDLLDLSRADTEVRLNLASEDLTLKGTVPLIRGPIPANGEVMVDWLGATTGILDTVGIFLAEIQVTSPEGRIQTTPSKLKFRIRKEIA